MDAMDDNYTGSEDLGDNLETFSRRLPDDCVEYVLALINTTLSAKEQHARLERIRKEALKLKRKYLEGHIWQRDGFDLKPDVQSRDGMFPRYCTPLRQLTLNRVQIPSGPHELWRLSGR
jgi:hypothetical protein